MRGHVPAEETLNRIAAVLEVAPDYLRGGYAIPAHLAEDDVLFLADFRNVPYIKMVREDKVSVILFGVVGLRIHK